MEDPKVLDAPEQKLFTAATWRHGFLKTCVTAMLGFVKDIKTILEFIFTVLSF
jgi:hypothetical protein